MTLLVMLGAEGGPKALWASRFAIPVIDIPMVWLTLDFTHSPFTLSDPVKLLTSKANSQEP